MSWIEDIDKGLREIGKKLEKEGKKLEKEDKKNVRVDCPKCGEKDIVISKMRARHGHTRCPVCRAQIVVMMERV